MAEFDYDAPAELYSSRNPSRRAPVGYTRFATAAEAIRFAMEELPPERLGGASLEVDDERFDGAGIRTLYASDAYPLPRPPAADAPI
jgi:hypothetical protein